MDEKVIVKEDSLMDELLKHKDEIEKSIEQTVANLNFLQGQKSYNQSLIDKFKKE